MTGLLLHDQALSPWRWSESKNFGKKQRSLGCWAAIAALSLWAADRPVMAQSAPLDPTAPPSDQAAASDYYDFLRDFPTPYSLNSDFYARIGDIYGDDQTISETRLTLPSLWWNQEQTPSKLGGYRLVRGWLAYSVRDSAMRVVDLNVNSQIWDVLNYYERYAVLNFFGSAAKSFGYNLRLYDGSGFAAQLAGIYACDFPTDPDAVFSNGTTNLEQALPYLTCEASIDVQSLIGVGSND